MLGEAKKPVFYVINKADEETAEYLEGKLGASKVVATFGNEPRLSKAGLSGREISSRVSGAAGLTNFVIEKMGA
jgi:CO dehydrogenase nickel-insertion accessory protein CooC1